MKPLPRDLPALAAGGKPALARCLSALETAPDDPTLTRLLDAAWCSPRGVALGLTGPPGVPPPGPNARTPNRRGRRRRAGRAPGR